WSVRPASRSPSTFTDTRDLESRPVKAVPASKPARAATQVTPVPQQDSWIRGAGDLPVGQSHGNPVKQYFWFSEKYLSSVFRKINVMIRLSRLDEEGRTRRHDRGAGCDGRSR